MLSTNMNKANTPSSVSSLVHSTTKITVRENERTMSAMERGTSCLVGQLCKVIYCSQTCCPFLATDVSTAEKRG